MERNTSNWAAGARAINRSDLAQICSLQSQYICNILKICVPAELLLGSWYQHYLYIPTALTDEGSRAGRAPSAAYQEGWRGGKVQ